MEAQVSAKLKRTSLFVWVLASFLIAALIIPPLIAWLVTSFVELTGGERQNRPAVSQQDLLKLRGASDAQSEIEVCSISRLISALRRNTTSISRATEKSRRHKSPGCFKWRRLRRLWSRSSQRVAKDPTAASSRQARIRCRDRRQCRDFDCAVCLPGRCPVHRSSCEPVPQPAPGLGAETRAFIFLARQRLLCRVISTGRRNTLVKSLCWRLEVQRFPGPLVELACHLVQLGLGVRREIKALGEVLAQQAIGVFA